MNPYGVIIADELRQTGTSEKAEWWNRYMKGTIPFIGAGIPEIRAILLERNRSEGLDSMPMNRQVGMVNGLMRGRYAEEKLAAILFVQLFWAGKQKNSFLMNLISDWFDQRYIFDWNTTDWLSVKVLAPLVDSGDPGVIWILKKWNTDSYLWKARASVVPFARSRNLHDHSRDVYRLCDILIRRKERFAKTAVGWVLREYSKIDPEFVLSFLSRHVKYTTAEVKRNALKYYRQSQPAKSI